MQARGFICGCSGYRLSGEEKRFLSSSRPWGLILFSRNIESPAQLAALVGEFRSCVGWHAPVLVDQ